MFASSEGSDFSTESKLRSFVGLLPESLFSLLTLATLVALCAANAASQSKSATKIFLDYKTISKLLSLRIATLAVISATANLGMQFTSNESVLLMALRM